LGEYDWIHHAAHSAFFIYTSQSPTYRASFSERVHTIIVQNKGAAEARSLFQTTESLWMEILCSDLELPRVQKFIIIQDRNYPDTCSYDLTSTWNTSGTALI